MSSVTHNVPTATTPEELPEIMLDLAGAVDAMAHATPHERADWLAAGADALDDAAPQLVPIARDETSLPETRLFGEIARTTGQLRHFAEVLREGSYLEASIDHADPDTSPPRPDLRRMLHPLGSVAVFAAGNFPFAFSVAGGDTSAALAAGCPVVVKVHPGHPRLSHRSAEILSAGLNDGGAPRPLLGLAEGLETGKALVAEPAIKAVGFTGSLQAGRALFDLAMARPDPIPFYGELGSLNPVVISPKAAARRSAELAAGLANSFTLGVGQFCTKPGFVMLPKASPLLSGLQQELDASERAPMLNHATADRFLQALHQLIGFEGIEVVAGDPERAVVEAEASPVVVKTSVDQVKRKGGDLLTECFGPLTVLVEYESPSELQAAVDAFPGSLTFTFHAEEEELGDLAAAFERARELAGRVIFGGWPTGVAVSWAQHHGGPWPATTASLHTSVGATAIRRFLRPVAYQDVPPELLPAPLQDANPMGIPRREDGRLLSRP